MLSTACRISSSEAVPVTVAVSVLRSTLTLSTPSIWLMAFSTFVRQWLQLIPLTR